MKKHILYITIVFILCNSFNGFASDPISTQGTRFWVSFMKNNFANAEPELTFKLIISAKKGCQGIISNPNTTWSQSFNVEDNGITEIIIPGEESYTGEHEIISKKGLLVTSTDTISLFASNHLNHSFDVSNVLPEEILGDEYIVQTYPPTNIGNDPEFLIVATENNTTIDIIPTSPTLGKDANTLSTIILNQGETFLVKAYGDLSGSKIKARNGKKIAVFNGNVCVFIPVDHRTCDHIFEQAPPLTMWGRQFILTNSLDRDADRIRVTASTDDTDVYTNGKFLQKLKAGETLEFEIGTYFETTSFLETSKPCVVYLYLVSHTYEENLLGDPAMVIIPPIEQQISEITFGVFDTNNITDHKVNIVTFTSQVPNMELDGDDISSQFEVLPGNPKFSYARLNINAGAHTLKNEYGFLAHVYGISYERDRESYAYSIGSSARNLRNQLFVNNISHLLLEATDEFCRNDTIIFEAIINYIPKSLLWKFDGVPLYTEEKFSHVFSEYGTYQVDLIVEREEGNPPKSIYDTISVELNVPNKERIIVETICPVNPYYFNEKKYNETGEYLINIPQNSGCDSIIYLNLVVLATLKMNVEKITNICATDDTLKLVYETLDGELNTLSVEFEEKANKVSFQNFYNIKSDSTNFLKILIPKDIYPDKYHATVFFEHPCHGYDTAIVDFEINYPAIIMEQKWNDVIALLNDKFNGGYTFSSYQWYKNNVPLAGETKSYIYVPGSLDFGAQYTVELTRMEDGLTLFTCPYTPKRRNELKTYPHLVNSNEEINIETNEKGQVIVWDSMGLKIGEYPIEAGKNIINAPRYTGIFILVISTLNGEEQIPIIVK